MIRRAILENVRMPSADHGVSDFPVWTYDIAAAGVGRTLTPRDFREREQNFVRRD